MHSLSAFYSKQQKPCLSVAEHKRFVQLLDMRFKDINAYMEQMSGDIDKYLQVSSTLLTCTASSVWESGLSRLHTCTVQPQCIQ